MVCSRSVCDEKSRIYEIKREKEEKVESFGLQHGVCTK